MPDTMKNSAERSAAVLAGLSPEDQSRIGKKVASIIDLAMDLAEDLAPILAAQADPDIVA